MSFPRLTREQVREIDRRAVADFGIPSIVLMENAARSAADVATQMLDGIDKPAVQIVCGTGNNGGDGFAIARHLHNHGILVSVACDWQKPLTGDAETNRKIVQAMDIEQLPLHEADVALRGGVDMCIDALFGTGLSRPVAGEFAGLINALNASKCPILAIDVPSGLDCNTGLPLGPCIRAKRTVTFVASKKGFDHPNARDYTGFISIGDIGVPRELIDAVIGPA